MQYVLDRGVQSMKAYVDSSLCMGCGICEIICPEVFAMRNTGKDRVAVTLNEHVPDAAVRFCRDARDCCKPSAITLEPVASP